MQLYQHQIDALKATDGMNRVAYYHEMGTGKTFTGAEKMVRFGGRVNLVVCQKSKIDDWVEHFRKYYGQYLTFDLTDPKELEKFVTYNFQLFNKSIVGIINYELVFRRPTLTRTQFDTIMLDESSMIQNDTAKRTKAILKLKTDNVILLSGTPTGGKYENLYSQMRLLGWNISKTQYYAEFIETRKIDVGGVKIPVVIGYKNVGRLKRKMRQFGCHFLKSDEIMKLPEQTFIDVKTDAPKEYWKFKKNRLVVLGDHELIGDTALTQMLGERLLCGAYAAEKLNAFSDLLQSTDDRLIVFYNFNVELDALKAVCKSHKRPVSEINGMKKDLDAYERRSDSVTLIQYQSGAMGLNLQKANKIIYYTPPLSSELYEQSKKRTHRIGQIRPCFYYRMICNDSIECAIYSTLERRADYTERLFVKG